MKKKLATVTMMLATALLAASCGSSDVTLKTVNDGNNDKNGQSIIFSIKTADGTQYYTADDLLGDLKDSSSAKSSLYSEISRKVFAQYARHKLSDAKVTQIEKDAQDEVTEFKDNCQSSAKDEGTDYDTYLENALAEKGVSTTSELEALFLDQGLKSAAMEDYLKETSNYNYFLDNYLTAYTPFQVKHILVAANTADSKFKDGTMSIENARKLLSIINRFKAGESFESIAQLTDDTSSANDGGIMPFNQAQNYVPEFRFATYVQEIFGNHTTDQERYDTAAKLHIINNDEESKDYVSLDEFKDSNLFKVYQNGIGTISLDDIMALNNPVDTTMAGAYNYFKTDDDGAIIAPAELKDADIELPTVAEQPYEMNVTKYDDKGNLNKKYYEEYELQRNQIFNETLNTHQVKYIELGAGYPNANSTTIGGKTVLADQNGNPVFVALASTGIHFMSMVWNSYAPYAANSTTSPKLSDEVIASLGKVYEQQSGQQLSVAELKTNPNALNQAYFTLFDTSVSDYTEYQYTYIGRNGAYKTRSTLSSNSDSLLSDLTSYASGLEYYVFNSLVYSEEDKLETKSFSLSFYDAELADIIKEYVEDKLNTTDESFASSVQSSAETYGSKLAREAEVKEASANWKYHA